MIPHPYLRKPVQMAHYHKRPTVPEIIGWILSLIIIFGTFYALATP